MSKILLYFIFFLSKINCLLPNEEIQNNSNLKETLKEDDSNDIIIIHTNDVHCGFMDNIGYDGLMLYKKELQNKYKNILTVDVGDHLQGDTIGLLSKGLDIIEIMNKIGYDVVSLGMHEFDYGLDSLINCNKSLKCGYISSNFCYRKNKTSIFPKYVIKEIGGKKLAFLGVITPETLTKTYLSRVIDENKDLVYDFLNGDNGNELYSTIQNYTNEIQETVDYIILLSYLGNDNNENMKQYTSGAVISKTIGFTAVIDGHSHQVYNITIQDKSGYKIPLSQVGTKLNNIGVIRINNYGNVTSEIISEVPKPKNSKGAEEVERNNKKRWVDTEMKEFLINIINSHSEQLNQQIGKVNFDLIINIDPKNDNNQLSRSEETSLGNLITDAIRNEGEGDISIMSAGSIRSDLKIGNITYKNIIDILPYSNDIIVKEVKGQDILDAIEYGVRNLPEKSPRFPQVSGISFKVDITFDSTVEIDNNQKFDKVKGDRRVYDAKVGNEKLDPNKIYRVSFDNFIGGGGDGYSMFSKYEEKYNTLKPDNQALIDFIKEKLNGTIPDYYNSTQGRIIINSNNNDSKGVIIAIIVFFIIVSIFFLFVIICVKRKKNLFKKISSNDIENIDNNNIEEEEE